MVSKEDIKFAEVLRMSNLNKTLSQLVANNLPKGFGELKVPIGTFEEAEAALNFVKKECSKPLTHLRIAAEPYVHQGTVKCFHYLEIRGGN